MSEILEQLPSECVCVCDGDSRIAELLLNGAESLNSSDCMPLCLQW